MKGHPFFEYSESEVKHIIEFYLFYELNVNKELSRTLSAVLYILYRDYLTDGINNNYAALNDIDTYFLAVHEAGGFSNYISKLVGNLTSELFDVTLN